MKLIHMFMFLSQVAIEHKTGFIFESSTWRASQDWADKLGIAEEVKKQFQIIYSWWQGKVIVPAKDPLKTS